ncbi:hypothetical protein J6590_072113 [Homalodisca vitripennis]|nr:hypothetical protein J6590_072113 [Homalodisca vitripennis]
MGFWHSTGRPRGGDQETYSRAKSGMEWNKWGPIVPLVDSPRGGICLSVRPSRIASLDTRPDKAV